MTKPLILIIEDDPKLAAIYQMTLQQIGFDIALDMNGNQYSTMLSTARPAVIILDLHMPFASGMDILQEIRCDPRLMDIPVIVTTADLVLVKSVQGQVQETLMKPVSVARLREAVRRLCPESM